MKPLPFMSEDDPATSVVKAYAATQTPHYLHGILLLTRLSLYLAFVIVMTTSAFTSRAGPDSYFMFHAAKQLYITEDFGKIATRFEAVTYIADVIATRNILDYTAQNSHISPGVMRGEFGMSMASLRTFSTVRLRQQKVRRGCTQYEQTRIFGPCFPPLTEATIDKAPFVGPITNKTYVYSESKVRQKIQGRIPNIEYEAGGNIQFLDPILVMPMMFASSLPPTPHNTTASTGGLVTEEIVRELVYHVLFTDLLADEWVNGSTRVLFADLSVMQSNSEFSLFASLNFIFEFPHSGGCVTSFQMLPFVLFPEMQFERKVVFALLALLVFVEVVVQSCQFFRRGRRGTCIACGPIASLKGTTWYACMQCDTKYDRFKVAVCPNKECSLPVQHWEHVCVVSGILLSPWNWIIIVNVTLCAVSEIFFADVRQEMLDSIAAFMKWKVAFDSGARELPPYTEFAPLQTMMSSAFAMLALNVMISFMALYFFLRHIEIFGRFLRLFSSGATLLASFTMTFSVAFFGFAITMYLSLATQTEGFQTLEESIEGTFRLLLGDMSLNELFSDAPWLIILLYFLFGIMYIFIALNVFISIVTNAYEVAMEQTPDDKDANGLRLLFRKVRGLEPTMASLMEEKRSMLERQSSEGDVVVETPLKNPLADLPDLVQEGARRSLPPDQLSELAEVLRRVASQLSSNGDGQQNRYAKATVVIDQSGNGSLSPRPFSETISGRVWGEAPTV